MKVKYNTGALFCEYTLRLSIIYMTKRFNSAIVLYTDEEIQVLMNGSITGYKGTRAQYDFSDVIHVLKTNELTTKL